MYQQGTIANKSMAMSKMLGGEGLAGKSLLVHNKSAVPMNRSMKKAEGQDLGRTTKSNF